MNIVIIVLAVAAVSIIFILMIFLVLRISKKAAGKSKSRNVVLAAGLKKLAQNPNDAQALRAVGEIYIQDKDWEKAYATFARLQQRSATLPPTEQLDINIKYGLVSLKTNRIKEAKQGFLLARTIDPENFDINYNLGFIHYLEKDYEKAIPLLRKALIISADNLLAKKYLGYSYLKANKYNDAMPYLKAVFDINPDDKETLFAIGQCFFELGMNDNALKILTRLRLDEKFGAESALYAGVLYMKISQYEKACENFGIGLKHNSPNIDVQNELKYRYAQSCIKLQDIGKALTLLKEIQAVSPAYKDTAALIMKYQELNQNKALRTYLMAGQSEFVGLCRKIVAQFYPNAQVKIIDITILTNYTDVVASIDTDRFTDTAAFRFFRSQGSVGELLLRDFHEHIKELKAGNGACFSAGSFSDEAVKFAEGRPIELYDKDRLNKLLSTIN